MKKRNLKSLELNKKTVSTFEASKLNGGSTFSTLGSYIEVVSYGIGIAAYEAIQYVTDYIE